MSKEYNDIEQYYRDNMFDGELSVDKDDMWNDLQGRMDKKKRRKIIAYWFLGALFVIGLSIMAIYWSTNSNSSDPQTIAPNDSSTIQDSVADLEYTSGDESMEIKENKFNNEDKRNDEINSNSASIITEETKPDIEKNLNTNTSTSDSNSLDEDSISETYLEQKDLNNIISNSSTKDQKYKDISSAAQITTYNQSISTEKNQGVNQDRNIKTSEIIEATDQQDLPSLIIESSDNKRTLIASDLIKGNNASLSLFDIKSRTEEIQKTSDQKFSEKLDELEEQTELQNKKSRFNINYNIAYYHPLKASLEPYTNMIFSYGQQLNLDYNFAESWSGSLGLEYLNIYEKFRWESIIETQSRQYADDAYYYINNGIKENFGDTVTVRKTVKSLRQTRNHHKLWSIPIGITFSKTKGRFAYSLSTQAIINIRHQFSGLIMTDNLPTIYDPSMNKYRKRIGLMYNFNPSVSYRMSKNASINIGTPVRISSGSWFDDSERGSGWNAVGIQVGIRWRM